VLPFKSGFKSFEIAANGRPRSFWEASMEVGVFYAHRWLIRGVMYSSAVRNRRSVSGTDCGPSFARFGSAIWTKSRPRTGARITRVLCIAVCGGKGSLLGSRVRPTAVKPMLWPKVKEERVGEA